MGASAPTFRATLTHLPTRENLAAGDRQSRSAVVCCCCSLRAPGPAFTFTPQHKNTRNQFTAHRPRYRAKKNRNIRTDPHEAARDRHVLCALRICGERPLGIYLQAEGHSPLAGACCSGPGHMPPPPGPSALLSALLSNFSLGCFSKDLREKAKTCFGASMGDPGTRVHENT